MKKDPICVESERLRLAFDLFEAGLRMQLAQLRRLHGDEGAERLEARLRQWLQTRPGALEGDAVGRPLDLKLFHS